VPRRPALERICGRADRQTAAVHGFEATLFELFNVVAPASADLPVAAVTHQIDFDSGHDGCWMRADPVYLHADRDRLLLFDGTSFALDRTEAETLAAGVNAALADRGLRVEIGRDPGRWYVRLPVPPEMLTTPPLAARGGSVAAALPRGGDAIRWLALANEVQMILHASRVNQARQARGAVPVNSLWWWGAGVLPAVSASPWSRVVATDPLAVGLARLRGCPCGESTIGAVVDRTLVVVDPQAERGADAAAAAALDRLSVVENRWCAPLYADLRAGRIDALELRTRDTWFRLTRFGRLRFWRPLSPFIAR